MSPAPPASRNCLASPSMNSAWEENFNIFPSGVSSQANVNVHGNPAARCMLRCTASDVGWRWTKSAKCHGKAVRSCCSHLASILQKLSEKSVPGHASARTPVDSRARTAKAGIFFEPERPGTKRASGPERIVGPKGPAAPAQPCQLVHSRRRASHGASFQTGCAGRHQTRLCEGDPFYRRPSQRSTSCLSKGETDKPAGFTAKKERIKQLRNIGRPSLHTNMG